MTDPIVGVALSLAFAYGVFLLFARSGSNTRGSARAIRPRTKVADWLVQAGADEVDTRQLLAMSATLFAIGALASFALFGGPLPALVAGLFAATFPLASLRARRERRRAQARESWPRMIEEVRLLTGSVGRSIPQALLDVGQRAPNELRPAFAAAEREWLISTDFARTCTVLKARLGDPTADVACETLLVAHEVGGMDVDRRLAALAEDCILDLGGRKDAVAKQAGVRFARRFVLAVPVGMALAGLSIGTGRAAYQTAEGQVLVAAGLVVVAGCWLWAGRLLRLPEPERVFR